jgi:hypothetical protein
MARGFFGLAPFLKHQRRDAFQLRILLRGADMNVNTLEAVLAE